MTHFGTVISEAGRATLFELAFSFSQFPISTHTHNIQKWTFTRTAKTLTHADTIFAFFSSF